MYPMGYGVRLFQVVALLSQDGPMSFEDLLEALPAPAHGPRPVRFSEDLLRFLAEAEGRYVVRDGDGRYEATEFGRANFLSLRGSVSGGDWEIP